MDYLKAETVSTGHYRVLALPFGGPRNGKDYDGDYFSPRTDPKPEWFPERPVIFHHGKDPWVGDTMIGRQGEITKSNDGWWGEMWLDKANRYFEQMDSLISRGKMFGSSATMGHFIKKAADGELLVWPHCEQTLSPIPRNPYSVVRATKALDEYSSAGIRLNPGFEGILKELDALSNDLRLQTSATGEDAAKAQVALNRVLDEVEAFVKRF